MSYKIYGSITDEKMSSVIELSYRSYILCNITCTHTNVPDPLDEDFVWVQYYKKDL